MSHGADSGTSVWENFDANNKGVMRSDLRANHPTRFFIYELIREEFGLRHFRWLDVGVAGMVDYEHLVGKLNFTFTGADISGPIIEDSRKYLRQEGDQVLVWNVEEPIDEAEKSMDPDGFDLVTVRHVLNHVSYYEQPLLNLHHLLDSQGLCIITLHLNLIDGDDQLTLKTDFPLPGVLRENRYNRDKCLRFLAQHFCIERFIRFDDGRKPNDVILARKRRPGTDIEPLPRMEVRHLQMSLRSLLSKGNPRPLKRLRDFLK